MKNHAQTYIGVKMIQAEKALRNGRNVYPLSGGCPMFSDKDVVEEGYEVTYSDGYKSFSPKAVFEKAYMEITGKDNKVSQADVESFIVDTVDMVIGEKTSVVQATLKNGFTITESSSCVDPSNFDHEMGKEICLKRIQDKVWFLLGFLLQSGVYGFSYKK